MIEVYLKGKKRDKIIGLVDGKKYLNKKKKLWGYLDEKIAKDKRGYPLLYLKDDGKITLNEDWDYEEQGYLTENKIYYCDTDELILSFHKDKKEIQNHLNNETIYLRGDGIDSLTNLDFFGISAIMLELFAGAGSDEGVDIEDFLDDLL
ncbi:MAG: hypothetical protein ACFFCE_17695 [Promethearchaeota archaeon]